MYKTAPAIREDDRQVIRRWLEIDEDQRTLYVLPAMCFDLGCDGFPPAESTAPPIQVWRRRCMSPPDLVLGGRPLGYQRAHLHELGASRQALGDGEDNDGGHEGNDCERRNGGRHAYESESDLVQHFHSLPCHVVQQ